MYWTLVPFTLVYDISFSRLAGMKTVSDLLAQYLLDELEEAQKKQAHTARPVPEVHPELQLVVLRQ
jgi:hypothetical protein